MFKPTLYEWGELKWQYKCVIIAKCGISAERVNILLCEAKRQYLLTLQVSRYCLTVQVSRYCLLTLYGIIVRCKANQYLITLQVSRYCLLALYDTILWYKVTKYRVSDYITSKQILPFGWVTKCGIWESILPAICNWWSLQVGRYLLPLISGKYCPLALESRIAVCMLGQRRRRWTNIKPTLGQCLCTDINDNNNTLL